MPKSHIVRIQDSVHGLMEFRGMEAIVVDVLRTPEVQRLRRIRQLGLAHYVFPGAEHSRLVHSLGAAWLAIRFGRQLRDSTRGYLADALRPSENAIADLALAALLHDLGHGPLSHAWEREVIGDDFDRTKLLNTLSIPADIRPLLANAPWHEITTAGLLLWGEGELHKLLEENDRDSSTRIVRLLRGDYWLEYLPGLLSSDVDVDRADFLRRDTHQCGVAYGRYDLDWLISTCTVGTLPEGGWAVGFDARKAPRVIEQFLVARIALYETVYCHKTVRSVEGMVKNLFRRLKVDAPGGASTPSAKAIAKSIAGEPLTQEDILRLDDSALLVFIEQLSEMDREKVDPVVRDLAQRILSRELFKLVPAPSERVEEFLQKEGAYEKIYSAMKPFCPGDPRDYLVCDDYSKSFFNKDGHGESKEVASSYLVDNARVAKPLHSHPDLASHKSGIKATRLFTLDTCIQEVRNVVMKK